MKYKYVGEAEKVFPHLGITVKPGDEFDAPAGFVATGVIAADAKSHSLSKPKADDEVKDKEPTEPSAASDTTLGE